MLDTVKLLAVPPRSRCRSAAARDAEILFLRQQLIILPAFHAKSRQVATPRQADLRLALPAISVRSAVHCYLPTGDTDPLAPVRLPSVPGAGSHAGEQVGHPSPLISAHWSGGLTRRTRSGEPHASTASCSNWVITIAQSSVTKYMGRRQHPPSQGWKTFLRNHAPQIAAVDLFVVPTIGFKLLYALGHSAPGATVAAAGEYHGEPYGRMGRAADHRGIPVGPGASLPDPRSRRCLWRCRQASAPRHGHSRSTDGAALAVAERPCRATDRLHPARSASTISWCLAKVSCAVCWPGMPVTTTPRERASRSAKTRRSAGLS